MTEQAKPRRDWHKLARHNGHIRLHVHTSKVWGDGSYHHYDVAHNLTRWQAFKLGARLILKAASA